MRSWIHHALWVSVFLVYSSGFTTFPPFASKGSQLFQSQGSLSAKSILLATTLLSAERLEENHPIGLYIHIPYCRRRCRYCNFAIVPIGSVSTEPTLPEDDGRASRGFEEMNRNYLKSLLTEIRNIQLVNGTQISLGSIYFGGGTPSLAPIKMIATILHEICCDENSPFSLETNAEITMEMDPGTFSAEKLQALKELGINRISLGVQVRPCSFLSFKLRWLEPLK